MDAHTYRQECYCSNAEKKERGFSFSRKFLSSFFRNHPMSASNNTASHESGDSPTISSRADEVSNVG